MDWQRLSLGLIDSDSYQFSSNGKSFRCQVGMSEYTPPEYQGGEFKTLDPTIHPDFFAVHRWSIDIKLRCWRR